MDATMKAVAQTCLDAADSGALTFPQILALLGDAGFESYSVDFRRGVTVYYATSGAAVELPSHRANAAPAFDPPAIAAAIRDAQTLAPGYTYRGFCARVTAAGCAGYTVSLSGRRAVYFGRTAETHVEMFPGQP